MFEKRARVEATLESEKMNFDEIVRALRENAEWCDANEYEVPLCMGDNQRAAADLIESLQAQLSTSQRREKAAVCDGCAEYGKWENEIEYGYPSPCTRCKRRCTDNWRGPQDAGEGVRENG